MTGHSISSWFTNAGWPATAPAAKCSAFPLLQGSSSLRCLLLPKDSIWPSQVQTSVWREAVKGQRTDRLLTVHHINSSLTSSRMNLKLQWTTDNSVFSVLPSQHPVLHSSAPEQLLSPRIPATVQYISLHLPWMQGREGHFTSRWWNLSRLCVQAF